MVKTPDLIKGHIVLYMHRSFHGASKQVFNEEPNLNADDDKVFNDRVSSFVILTGRWKFYRDTNYKNAYN